MSEILVLCHGIGIGATADSACGFPRTRYRLANKRPPRVVLDSRSVAVDRVASGTKVDSQGARADGQRPAFAYGGSGRRRSCGGGVGGRHVVARGWGELGAGDRVMGRVSIGS